MEKVINARFLTDLKRLVMNGEVSQEDIRDLHEQYATGDIGDILAEYRESGNMETLDKIDEKMAVKAIIYKSRVNEVPVVLNGSIVSSKRLEKVYYDRPWIPGVVPMRWEDEASVRKNNVDHPKHAPMSMEFKKHQLTLVCETADKSFYFKNNEIPSWVQAFLLPKVSQKVSDLATALKRPGITLEALKQHTLNTSEIHTLMVKNKDGVEKDIYDQGVLVTGKDMFRKLMDYIGIKGLSPLQITLIGEGIYFKGTVTCETLANMPTGFYGGIKKAESRSYNEKVQFGAVMDSYVHTPWRPSLNRQQTDYMGADLQVHIDLPSQEVIAKALSGFGPHVTEYNNKVMASAGKMLKKMDVKGYAGKASIGWTEQDVHFVIKTNKVKKERIEEMVWLTNPSLPSDKEIPLVRVLIQPDSRIDGHLIQVNMNKSNHQWLCDIFICLKGRDSDGDGYTLSNDPIFWSKYAKHLSHCDDLTWTDTTKYKKIPDTHVNNIEAAIRLATYRIRTASGDVGRVTNLTRRIYQHDALLLNAELREDGTGAIQTSITAQKGKVDRERWSNGWIYRHLDSDTMKDIHAKDQYEVFLNMHDTMNGITAACKKILNTEQEMKIISNKKQDTISIARYKEVKKEHGTARSMLKLMRTRIKTKFPHKHSALTKTLGLIITKNDSNDETFRVARSNAEVMYATASYSLGVDRLIEMDEQMIKIRKIWGSVGRGEDNALTYKSAARIIKAKILTMYETYGEDNVIASVVAGPHKLSDSLLAKIINEKHMAKLGMDTIMYIPIAIKKLDQSHQEGRIIGRGELTGLVADRHFVNSISNNERFQIIKAIQYDGINWNTNSGSNKQSSYLLKVRAL